MRPWLLIITVIAAGFLLQAEYRKKTLSLSTPTPESSFFTSHFPAHEKFQDELALMRAKGRLETSNEALINQTVFSASEKLKMPPAVLWCLLFQESRLNHLEGLGGDQGARGLGQFSHFSFYEVNHHLDRFTKANLEMMNSVFGRDIRPVMPLDKKLESPSSYFYIPTAVVSSAAFLNNRYLQLKRVLERNHLTYHPELLWVYASMAYNKGGRSVIAFWNDIRRRGGKYQLERMTNEPQALFAGVTDVRLLTRTLRKIWSGPTAAKYARELDVHMENMRECSFNGGGKR